LIALSIAGWSGSGKTTLITALIPILRRRGLTVSTIKHAHHDLLLDQPGKDSFRHAAAGAEEVILAAGSRYALFSQAPAGLPDLLARLAPVDLVLVEGFKHETLPKLEVYRPSLGKTPLWPNIPVLAVAADAALPDCPVPVLDLALPEKVADFIIAMFGLNTPQRAEE
jgi:molybdopterin-guanine dinucleotide biosynthesis protein B